MVIIYRLRTEYRHDTLIHVIPHTLTLGHRYRNISISVHSVDSNRHTTDNSIQMIVDKHEMGMQCSNVCIDHSFHHYILVSCLSYANYFTLE